MERTGDTLERLTNRKTKPRPANLQARTMDRFYDKKGASEALEDIAELRREALAARKNSSIVHLADATGEDLVVQEMYEGRQNWRLCVKAEGEEVAEEVVMRLQGILSVNNLVPTNVQACPSHKAIYLTQQAELCGQGTATFNEALDNVPSIVDRFAQHLGGAEVSSGGARERHGLKFFSASNRIFTAQIDAPNEQDNAFEEGVDPFRMLSKFKTGKLIHAPENMVKYFKRVADDDTKPATYEAYYPGGFMVGDIVEMQLSLVAVVTGKDKAKEARAARAKAMGEPTVNRAVRRKVGYFAADEDEERKIKKKKTEDTTGEDTQMD